DGEEPARARAADAEEPARPTRRSAPAGRRGALVEGHGRQRRVGGQFGLAVVGLGEGKGLVKGLAGHPDLKVRVVCDLDAGLAARTAAAYGVPRWTTSVEEAVAEPGVDIVCVYTPDSLHLAHIELAL